MTLTLAIGAPNVSGDRLQVIAPEATSGSVFLFGCRDVHMLFFSTLSERSSPDLDDRFPRLVLSMPWPWYSPVLTIRCTGREPHSGVPFRRDDNRFSITMLLHIYFHLTQWNRIEIRVPRKTPAKNIMTSRYTVSGVVMNRILGV